MTADQPQDPEPGTPTTEAGRRFLRENGTSHVRLILAIEVQAEARAARTESGEARYREVIERARRTNVPAATLARRMADEDAAEQITDRWGRTPEMVALQEALDEGDDDSR